MPSPSLPLDDSLENTAPSLESTPSGPITFDEVRAAFDAGHTNARTVIEFIGRGSMATAQKHLRRIRGEQLAGAGASAPSSSMTPPAPPEALQAIWEAAWGKVTQDVGQRLLSLLDERERLSMDKAGLEADIAELEQVSEDAEAAAVKARHELAEALREVARMHALVSEMEAKGAMALASVQQQVIDIEKDAGVRVNVLTAALDRVGEREGELRARLMEQQRRNDELVRELASLAKR